MAYLTRVNSIEIRTAQAVIQGCEAFVLHEPRDAMYKTATFLVCHFWGRPAEMADSLGVLLLTWNQAHYRYGSFDFSKLESCIAKNMAALQGFRAKKILAYTLEDEPQVTETTCTARQLRSLASASHRHWRSAVPFLVPSYSGDGVGNRPVGGAVDRETAIIT